MNLIKKEEEREQRQERGGDVGAWGEGCGEMLDETTSQPPTPRAARPISRAISQISQAISQTVCCCHPHPSEQCTKSCVGQRARFSSQSD